jgi:hypothetical protein
VRTVTLRVLPGAARVAARRAIVLAALLALLAGVDARATGALPHQQAEAKLTASDESGIARLGYSVSLSADGNTALVGGPLDGSYGAVWVFVRESGQWHEQAKLQGGETGTALESCGLEAGEGGEDCNFGRTVSLSADGNTAIVGNPRESRLEPSSEPGGQSVLRRNVGAAWVYTRSGSSWTTRAQLLGGEEGGEGRFGKSVALSGDGQTALIGGPSDRSGGGSAWVFTRSGEGWTQRGPKLAASDEQGEGFFGLSVALSGDGHTAIIGGPGDEGFHGAAWIFSFAEGVWFQHGSKLTGAGESGPGRFGYSVALSGDAQTALVGARTDSEGTGAAWAFAHSSGGGWVQQGGKLASGGEGAQGFGYSVALSQSGDLALVGAPRDSGSRGLALQFERSAAAWSATQQLEAGVSQLGHRSWFGASVALSADGATRLVGGPSDNSGAGAAWVFGPAPAVAAVTPSQGPRAGGTEVTISGSNFSGATAVRFGASDALRFTVVSSETITAMTPPGEGSVDVTVSSQYGTSLAGVKFKYLGTTGGGGATGSAGAAGGSSTITVGGGVLGFTSGSACRVALVSRKITVRSHARAAFRLRVSGAGRCAGKLRVRVTRRVSHKRLQVMTIGTAKFSIPAGRSAVINVKLNRAGLKALRRHHWRLGASLLLVRQSPTPASAQTASIRLSLPTRRSTHA